MLYLSVGLVIGLIIHVVGGRVGVQWVRLDEFQVVDDAWFDSRSCQPVDHRLSISGIPTII